MPLAVIVYTIKVGTVVRFELPPQQIGHAGVFGLGAVLAGLAGLMAGPIMTVEIGMGEGILIITFVVIVIGGVGSIRGAFVAALIVGFIDTVGRSFLPDILGLFVSNDIADTAAPAISSMLIYILMALILAIKPQGLFPPKGA